MTALNFLLSRAFGRTLREGDEIVVTALDHDANVSPWLELAHDLGLVVHVAGLTEELEVDYDDLASKLSDRTRVVAFPVAANSVGTAPDVRRDRRARARRRRARVGGRRALRPARPDRRRRVGRRRPHLLAVQVLRAAHGARLRKARAARVVARVQGAAGGERARRTPLRARHEPARAPRRVRRGSRLHGLARLGRDARARARARRAVPHRAARSTSSCTGSASMEGRVPTFCFNVAGTERRRRSRASSPSATSPSGTATTTPSRR